MKIQILIEAPVSHGKPILQDITEGQKQFLIKLADNWNNFNTLLREVKDNGHGN